MDIDKLRRDFRLKLMGIGIVLVTFLLGYCANTQSQNTYAEKTRAYLNSTDFSRDFNHADSSPRQEVLAVYPKISFYLTFEHNKRTEFSESEQQTAEERKCDFIMELFAQLKPNKSQKTAILKLLKQDNVVIENIYRNKYAAVLYSTQQTLAQCEQWYPSQS
jgi:hypothetical protein